MITLTVLFLFIVTQFETNAQYDNGVVGDPMVNCADNYFEVHFETRVPYKGLMFVRDRLEDPNCRSQPSDSNGQRNATLRLGFKDCGIERKISTMPRGVFLSTTLIVAFHPDVLTKFDRVYKVQCFYMEMDRRLEKEIQVNMPPPVLHTKQVQMPVCKYEVLDGSPTGPPVYFATVGQMVYHKWTCEAQQADTFCMTVHSCFVDDGNGDRVQLINEQGCALDKYLLTNLEYPEDLVAGREAHVYKYADRDNMYFDCQITVRLKEQGSSYCDIPNCPDPPRRRRSQPLLADNESIETENGTTTLSDFIIPNEDILSISWFHQHFDYQQIGICMTTMGVLTLLGGHISAFIISAYLVVSSVIMRKAKIVH